jgi:glycosyltransferase involved in cell wall biosynthesis
LAIESVLRQTSSNWQCIVIDDCGGESAELLVRGYSTEKIRYVSNGKTLGLSANWNRAIELAETPLLTIFHADDVMGENYVMNTIEAFSRHPEISAAHCRAQLIDEENILVTSPIHRSKDILKPRGARGDLLLQGDKGLRSITLADWIICPTLTYRTSVVKGMTFNRNLKFATDLEFIARLFFADHSILSRNEIDYLYRIHKNSQTTKMKHNGQRFIEEWIVISWIGNVGKCRKWNGTRFIAATKPVLRAHLLYEATSLVWKFQFKSAFSLIRWAIYKPPAKKLLSPNLN